MDTIKYPGWQRLYLNALKERDPQKLNELVSDAEGAIFLRMQELDGGANDQDELKAIQHACDGLLAIKTKILKWPALKAEPQAESDSA